MLRFRRFISVTGFRRGGRYLFERVPTLVLPTMLLGVLVWSTLVLPGCAPPPSPTERTRVQEASRQINEIRADIGFLDGQETEGRETASRGFTRTAAYLAQQFRSAGLQPILAGEYRTQYAAGIRRVVSHRVEVVGRDTTRLTRGEDYLLFDIAGSSGTFGTPGPPEIPGVHWNADIEADTERGAWNVSIEVDEHATTAPMHIVGMIPGANPLTRDSVVVWLAPADASGLQGVGSWTDGSDLSIPAAALLSATRRAAGLQRTWASIPHTILVGFLSGTRDDCQGAAMLERHFPWDKELIARIVIADMASATSCDWESIWSDGRTSIEVLEAAVPFEAPADFGFGPFRPRSETQRPEALDVATSEALRLSREFLDRLP